MQTLVSVAETYFVGFLGTDALAGVALVFPALMLMTMMSNGGIGGGVSSAIARAIGAGRMRDAESLVGHTVVIALVFGALFSAALLVGGRALYGALGGSGEVLANALRYSSLVFGAAVPIWITNLLAAALRGAGNVRFPAILTAVGAAMTLALSPLLIFGWGPVPRFGVAGAGLAMILYYLIATTALIAYLRSPHAPVRLVRTRLEWRHLKDILGVGTSVRHRDACRQPHGRAGHRFRWKLWRRRDRRLWDGIAARLSADPAAVRAWYRVADDGRHERRRGASRPGASRCLDRRFHFGGHDRADRARVPRWRRRVGSGFSVAEPEVIQVGVDYLQRAAPFYAFYGFGMALYFASQGAGNVAWPLIAGFCALPSWRSADGIGRRCVGGSLQGLFWIVAASLVLFGLVNAGAFATGLSWSHLKPSAIR